MRLSTRRLLFTAPIATAGALMLAGPAAACGGLVGENGTVQLGRTTTLAAYHDGVEHYVTSFEFTGTGEEVGSIIPLPDIPTDVIRAGDWTLQRLTQEVAPPQEALFAAAADTAAGGRADVLLETKIDALELTVLRGGGDEVGAWALENGFFLTPDAPEVLDYYAQRSQIFLAARFDATSAAELGQNAGDGTPIQLTIPTDEPWVPLRILALGSEASTFIEADVFLLTDERPQLLAGGPGLSLIRSEEASQFLLDDLRSDKDTEWIPDEAWLTYLQLGAEAVDLDYDLAISTTPQLAPSVADAGIAIVGGEPVPLRFPAGSGSEDNSDWVRWAWVAGITGTTAIGLVLIGLRRSGASA